MSAEETFTSHALRNNPTTPQSPVVLKVTSPLFYSQVARCTSILEYIKATLSKPDPGVTVIHISHPDSLAKVFEDSPRVFLLFKMWPRWKAALIDKHAEFLKTSILASNSLLDRLRWAPIHLLRSLPSSPHDHALSDLDACAVYLPRNDAPKVRAYRKAVLKMLLSDYVAFGMPAVIDAALWAFKIWLCRLCAQSFDGLAGLCAGRTPLTVTEVGKVAMGCLGVHLWWGLGEVL